MLRPSGNLEYDWPFYLCGALAYLIGAIPFGLVVTRLAGLGDIRRLGSGNIGATNVLRTGHKGLAALTLFLDGAKGAFAVLAAGRLGPDMAAIAAGFAVLGHVFPVWLGFKGGKGVATCLGVLLAIAPVAGALTCATWLLVAWLFRYSSLAALSALALAPLYTWLFGDPQRAVLAAVVAALVWSRHHQNIRRLLKGEEPRIGGKRHDPEPLS